MKRSSKLVERHGEATALEQRKHFRAAERAAVCSVDAHHLCVEGQAAGLVDYPD
ncbi:hypothetical protein LJR290_007127 [Variovorax sp. LjRoot290]|uniref:hypothetical protein n=1 Tax=unclassified Variovorax TaxID=663243 RepID=UPI003ED13AE8